MPPLPLAQCRKRFNDVRRRAKQHAASRGHMHAAGGGPSVSQSLSAAEHMAVSTLSQDSKIGLEGIEIGLSASAPQADGAQGPKSEAAKEEMAELDEPVQQRGRSQNSQQRASDLAFLDLQQGGFTMLQRELGALRRSVNTRLCRMESRVYPLLVSTEVNLRRLADAAERCCPPFGNTESPSVRAATQSRSFGLPPRRGRRGHYINIWL
ncbi:uncharacterized protein LOC113540185 isoform X1 [Pangasianodon hypophthalmus]|uniref:uncharacterized protein LOC113540185 isoform X1 n=1 Tax=Pangasianodon hypophthalmus TaxID=310915 RepID=UPI000EFDF219|nr:uncharacterized protein LOC113540185 isoform X1 [Pangasianodon hypophthalmus]